MNQNRSNDNGKNDVGFVISEEGDLDLGPGTRSAFV